MKFVDKSELVEMLEDLIVYYNKGVTCSITESVVGERICKDILQQIESLTTITYTDSSQLEGNV